MRNLHQLLIPPCEACGQEHRDVSMEVPAFTRCGEAVEQLCKGLKPKGSPQADQTIALYMPPQDGFKHVLRGLG